MQDKFLHFFNRLRNEEVFAFNAVKPIFLKGLKVSLINFAGILLLFFTNYVIIKFVGEKAYGNYSIINVWINFFTVFLIFGFDDLFIAEVSGLNNNRTAIVSLIRQSIKVSFCVFLFIIVVVLALSHQGYLPSIIGEFKIYFFVLLIAMSLFTLLLAFFRSLNVIIMGQIFEKLFRPAIVLIFIFFTGIFSGNLSLGNLLSFQILSIVALLFVLWRLLNLKLKKYPSCESSYKASFKSNITFLGISLLYLLSTRLDLMVLSRHVAPQEVGYYNIAARIADMVGYPLVAINLVVHSLISKEYTGVEKARIHIYVLRISIFTFLLTGFIFLLIFFFGKTVLGFFGINYLQSFVPLLILSLSHLLYSISLPFNSLLMVSNRESLSLITLSANVLTTFILAYILVPAYASRGAAISVLGGSCIYLLITSCVIYRLYVHQKVQRAITSK